MSAKHPLSRAWVVLGGLMLLGAHVVALHHVSSRFALPAAAMIGVALLAVVTHKGVIARLHNRLRRRD